MAKTKQLLTPNIAALIGFLLALPITVLFSVLMFEMKPMEALFKSVLTNDGNMPNILGRIYMFVGLLALPVGLVISAWPMVRKGKDGKRRVYLANLAVVLLLLVVMYPIFGGLFKDFWRCDVLQIPYCD